MNVFVFFFILQTLPLTLQEVADNFHNCEEFFLHRKTPEIHGILEDGKILNQNRFKAICQLYNNKYRFATLYDTTNKIPVFSAYEFAGSSDTKRRSTWFIEPQLDGGPDKSMSDEGKITDKAKTSQVLSEDYKQHPNVYDRGHLFPVQHATDLETADSTFTLTNAVPQHFNFNRGKWCQMEKNVAKLISEHCSNSKAYVVTGALPGSSTLNNKINIPDLMWSAFCCKAKNDESLVGLAHYGKNEKNSKIERMSVKTLREKIRIDIFHEKCDTELNNDGTNQPGDNKKGSEVTHDSVEKLDSMDVIDEDCYESVTEIQKKRKYDDYDNDDPSKRIPFPPV